MCSTGRAGSLAARSCRDRRGKLNDTPGANYTNMSRGGLVFDVQLVPRMLETSGEPRDRDEDRDDELPEKSDELPVDRREQY